MKQYSIERVRGVNAMQNLFIRTLHNKEKIVRTILTDAPLVYLLGTEFAEWYMQERVKKGIRLKSLRTKEKKVDTQEHMNYPTLLKEVRQAPPHYHPEVSVVMWDNKVAYVAPHPLRATIVANPHTAKVTKELFEAVWANATS